MTVRFNAIPQTLRQPPSSIYLEQPLFDGYANGMTPLGQGINETIKFAKTTIRLNEPPIPNEYIEVPLSIARRIKAIPITYHANLPFLISQYNGVDDQYYGY